MKNFIKGELIGLKVKVVHCSDPTLVNRTGEIIDETKNTLLIKTRDREKGLPKTSHNLR